MIVDSAFTDLPSLAEELVEKGRAQGLFAPGFLVYIVMQFIRHSVSKLAGFDIQALSPIEHVSNCSIPVLFVTAEGDSFVPAHHTKKLFEKYAGEDKQMVVVDGDHNTPRPSTFYQTASAFLTLYLKTLPVPVHELEHR